MTKTITLRPPAKSEAPSITLDSPSAKWLEGTWHITHATLPMWRAKRNVRIVYAVLPSLSGSGAQAPLERLDDTVYYQPLSSKTIKTIHGIDVASRTSPGAWDWRGTGWLKIATTHWEILGYEDGKGSENLSDTWVVTYFSSTLFTPAGVDIFCRSPAGPSKEALAQIKEALGVIPDPELKKLAGELYEVIQEQK